MIAAETAGRAKSQFMSSMSHELRNTAQRHHRFSEIIAGGRVPDQTTRPANTPVMINRIGKHLLNVIQRYSIWGVSRPGRWSSGKTMGRRGR